MCWGTHVACTVGKHLCHCAAWHVSSQWHAHVYRHSFVFFLFFGWRIIPAICRVTRESSAFLAHRLISQHQRAVFSSRSQTICLFPPLRFTFPPECNFLWAAQRLAFHVCAHVLYDASMYVSTGNCLELIGQNPLVLFAGVMGYNINPPPPPPPLVGAVATIPYQGSLLSLLQDFKITRTPALFSIMAPTSTDKLVK